jgi:hypothetical protein
MGKDGKQYWSLKSQAIIAERVAQNKGLTLFYFLYFHKCSSNANGQIYASYLTLTTLTTLIILSLIIKIIRLN